LFLYKSAVRIRIEPLLRSLRLTGQWRVDLVFLDLSPVFSLSITLKASHNQLEVKQNAVKSPEHMPIISCHAILFLQEEGQLGALFDVASSRQVDLLPLI
jgi:hypothetical protein